MCAARAFPRTANVHQSEMVLQGCDADSWSFGLHSSLVLRVEVVLGKLGPGGIVGIRKLEKEKEEAVRDIDEMAVIEGGEKMKVRIKRSWKNTWIKVSLQG